MSYPFLKGHGTENDFVLLPDHDGSVHGDLDPGRVAALCDRRAGIGGDGVLRVVRSVALDPGFAAAHPEAEWFMDYRNADGSLSEMCGNGVRLFARHLVDSGLASSPVPIGTRDGVKVVTVEGERITADLGVPRAYGASAVTVGGRTWTARHVDMGNPHAVAFVASLDDAGPLLEEPGYDAATYPDGVNVEFVVRRGERHVALRVHERGSGETRSCGTGACAAAVAARTWAGPGAPDRWWVRVPGGTVQVTVGGDQVELAGPAVLVADVDVVAAALG